MSLGEDIESWEVNIQDCVEAIAEDGIPETVADYEKLGDRSRALERALAMRSGLMVISGEYVREGTNAS